MIKAVLFDMGNTLVDSRNTDYTIHLILKDNGIDIPVQQIKKALQTTHDEIDYHEVKNGHIQLTAEEHYTKWNSMVLEGLEINDPGLKLAREIYVKWFEKLHIYLLPNAQETLSQLREKGLKIGIITNGFREEIKEVFSGLPIQPDYFDIVVGCNTTGCPKPYPQPFEFALRGLGLNPDEVMFVGDSYKNDYLGSKEVGMRPVLYLPRGEPPAQAGLDVFYIRDLIEILDLI